MRFLTVQFNIAGCYWRYGSTSSDKKDEPEWYLPEEGRHMRIFELLVSRQVRARMVAWDDMLVRNEQAHESVALSRQI